MTFHTVSLFIVAASPLWEWSGGVKAPWGFCAFQTGYYSHLLGLLIDEGNLSAVDTDTVFLALGPDLQTNCSKGQFLI